MRSSTVSTSSAISSKRTGVAPPPEQELECVAVVNAAGHLRHDPIRPTAVSYECGSGVYLAALLEAIEAGEDHPQAVQAHRAGDGGGDESTSSTNSSAALANEGATVLRNIQHRLVERHVQNGTLTPKTVPVPVARMTTATRRTRRGGRRPRPHNLPPTPRNLRSDDDPDNERDADTHNMEEGQSRTILSFSRQE